MNTTVENQHVITTRRASARPVGAETSPAVDVEPLVSKRPASELTRLVFMVLLGAAACIALVGVVSEAGSPGTSPDEPAPDVIVHLAD